MLIDVILTMLFNRTIWNDCLQRKAQFLSQVLPSLLGALLDLGDFPPLSTEPCLVCGVPLESCLALDCSSPFPVFPRRSSVKTSTVYISKKLCTSVIPAASLPEDPFIHQITYKNTNQLIEDY